jgi:hypothetical protein
VVALTDGDTEAVAAAMQGCGVPGTAIVSRVRNWGARVDLTA